jgi:hypothetical protein
MTGFPPIHGHGAVKRVLRQTGAHALLFTGPESVGRRTVARWYAAWLNCEQTLDEPCGKCESCRLALAETHPDYREIAPEATTKSGRASRRPQLRIDELVPREGGSAEPLSRWLETRPRFKHRVGVIDQAESLTEQAANAFLKMLEEPPSYARIVLIAPSVQAVLPTLASRSLPVRFGAVMEGAASDPAARLGQPGKRLQAEQQPEAFEARRDSVQRYLLSLRGGLEEALVQADGLEKQWLAESPFDLSLLLRAELSRWPPETYAAAVSAVERCETALAAYASPGVAVQVLTLELREIVGKGKLSLTSLRD